MGAHEWIDIAQLVGLFASAIVAALLSARLARYDSDRKAIQDAIAELKQDVAGIKGFLKGTFKF